MSKSRSITKAALAAAALAAEQEAEQASQASQASQEEAGPSRDKSVKRGKKDQKDDGKDKGKKAKGVTYEDENDTGSDHDTPGPHNENAGPHSNRRDSGESSVSNHSTTNLTNEEKIRIALDTVNKQNLGDTELNLPCQIGYGNRNICLARTANNKSLHVIRVYTNLERMNQGNAPREFTEIKLTKSHLRMILEHKDDIIEHAGILDAGGNTSYEIFLSSSRPLVKLWCDSESSITQIRRMWINSEGVPARSILGVSFRLTEIQNFIRAIELNIDSIWE